MSPSPPARPLGRDSASRCARPRLEALEDRSVPAIAFLAGPLGAGAANFVSGSQSIPYTAGFEIQSNATAVDQVSVTHVLDDDLDLDTFTLGDFGFGSTVESVPTGLDAYSVRLDLRSSLGLFIDYDAALDHGTRTLALSLRAIDPSTDQPPADPAVGLLSPGAEGFMRFSVKPLADRLTGTPIDAVATVAFDGAAQSTPPTFHTLDADAPSSEVGLLAQVSAPSFLVTWAGSDVAGGSGLAAFDVFVSIDGGTPQPWLVDTTATSVVYAGSIGHEYAFTSFAIDAAGNRQELTTLSTTRTPIFTRALAALPEDSSVARVTTVRSLLGGNLSDADARALRGIAVTGMTGGGSWQYSLDRRTWRALRAPSEASALLLPETASVRFRPAADFSGSAGLVFRGWDRTYGSAGRRVRLSPQDARSAFTAAGGYAEVTITPSNDRPVLSGSAQLLPVVPTGTSAGQTVASLGYAAADADGDLCGIAVISASGPGVWQFSTDGTDWQPLGTANLDPTDLIRFVPSLGAMGPGQLTFRAWDGTASSLATRTATVTINNAPRLTPAVPSLTMSEDADPNPGFLVSALFPNSVTDDQEALRGAAITAANGQSNGTWQHSLDGRTWHAVSPVSGASALLLRSTDHLRFVPVTDYIGSVTLAFRAWDQTYGTAGGRVSVTQHFPGAFFSSSPDLMTLTVTAAEDRPVLNTTGYPHLTPYQPGQTPTMATVADLLDATDPDGDTLGMAVTQASAGWQYSLNGTDWSDVGPVPSGSVRLLAPEMLLRFAPSGVAGVAAIRYRAWDVSMGPAGVLLEYDPASLAYSLATATATAAVNHAPTLTGSVTFPDIPEDAVQNPGTLVSTLLGNRVSESSGLAVTDATTAGGRWQYSFSGTTWVDVGPVTEGAALLLRPTDRLRFLPQRHYHGPAALTFRAWDQTVGAAGARIDVTRTGGATAFSDAAITATLNVTPVNDAPVGSGDGVLWLPLAGASVAELLGTWVTDADGDGVGVAITAMSGGGRWQYSADGSQWQAVTTSLLLGPSYRLRFVPNAGFNGTASLRFRGWDGTRGTAGTRVSLTKLAGSVSASDFTARTQVNAAPVLSAG